MAIEDLATQKADFFKKRREQAMQQANAGEQEASDVINRRFAALGAQGSGAAIGAQLKAKDMAQAQKQQAMQGVDAMELESKMADENRQMAEKDLAMKRDIFGFEKESKLKELDLANRQFELDKSTTEFNKRLSEAAANEEPGKPHGLGRALAGTMKKNVVSDITEGIKKFFKF